MRSILVIIAAAGCGGSDSTTPDARAADARAIDAAPDAMPFVMTGTVTDVNQAPIESAQVCIVGHPEVTCAMTSPDGAWGLLVPFLPSAVDIAMTFSAAGYLDFVALQHETLTGTDWLSTVPLLADSVATTLLATNAGFTYPSTTTGFMRVDVEGAAGATVTITPASGGGPVYSKSDGTPDPTLTSTSVAASLVYFGNVTPGTYAVTATAPGKTCYDRSVVTSTNPVVGDWPPTGTETMSVEIVAGGMTDHLFAYCL